MSTEDDVISRRDFGKAIGLGTLTSALPTFVESASAQSKPAPVRPGSLDELCDMSATELVNRMRRKDVSAREVMTAHLARIERINPGQRHRHARGGPRGGCRESRRGARWLKPEFYDCRWRTGIC
jgi:hypothetical protein